MKLYTYIALIAGDKFLGQSQELYPSKETRDTAMAADGADLSRTFGEVVMKPMEFEYHEQS